MLVNNRHVYFRENQNLKSLSVWFPWLQAHLETGMRDAFVNKQFFVCVFLPWDGVRYTTWQDGILPESLKYWHTEDNVLLHFELSTTSHFQVWLGTTLSASFIQENDLPQGCILSVTLFLVKISSLSQVIPASVTQSLYVDDVQISFAACNMPICEHQLELSINRMTKWADENGFKLSTEKTVAVCFSRKRGLLPEPSLYLWGVSFPVRPEHKFLGVVFDKKLIFGSHVKSFRLQSQKKLNLMRVLSHNSWGADRVSLMRIYRVIVHIMLDYGCIEVS